MKAFIKTYECSYRLASVYLSAPIVQAKSEPPAASHEPPVSKTFGLFSLTAEG